MLQPEYVNTCVTGPNPLGYCGRLLTPAAGAGIASGLLFTVGAAWLGDPAFTGPWEFDSVALDGSDVTGAGATVMSPLAAAAFRRVFASAAVIVGGADPRAGCVAFPT